MAVIADNLDYNFQQVQKTFYKVDNIVTKLKLQVKDLEKRVSRLEK